LLYVRTGNTGTDPAVAIDDLGVTIPTGASWTLLSVSSPADPEGSSGQFTAREIRDSDDLYNAIVGGSLEWSQDGATVETAGDYVADFMLMQDFTDDHARFGRLTTPNDTTVPADGEEGELFWDSDEDIMYVHDGTTWVPFDSTITASGLDHGDLLGLGDDDHTQYLNETRHDALPADNPHSVTFTQAVTADAGTDITAAEAEQLTDGSNADALHSHTASGLSIDHHDLLGLLDDDHTQYLLLSGSEARNAVTGSIDMSGGDYFRLPQANDVSSSFPAGSEGALAWDIDDDTLYAHDGTQWFAIAPASGIITDHGGLTGLGDDDHAQYGLLAGNAARNPVTGEYDFTAGDLILPADGTLKGSPVEGNVEVKGGVLYTYDATRAKWLSVDRKLITAAKKGSSNDVYLRAQDGIATSETGIRVLRDGTITGLFAQTDTAETWTLEIRRNGVATVIASLTMTAVQGNQETTTNIDVSQGDELQFFANTSGSSIKSPIGGLELAWRTT
jgi:hypothetical protein